MLTETQARDLLAKAATTVDVGPPPPLAQPPHRRRIVPLVAAAAAVLLVAGGVAVARHGDTADVPAAPSFDTYPGDRSFRLGPDQIPPVEGETEAAATHLLQQRGYAVTTRTQPVCAVDGTVTAMSPAAGTIATDGQSVALTIAHPDGLPCPGLLPSSDPLLTWAEGEAAAPRFAQKVVVENDGGVVATLVGTARTDAAAWPGLQALVAAARGVSVVQPDTGAAAYRVVANTVDVTRQRCDRSACTRRTITVLGGGGVLLQAHLTDDASGAITAVDIVDRRTTGAVPDVVGDSAAYATARLGAFGYAVTQVPRTDCAPVGMVTKVAVDGGNALIGVTDRTGACNRTALTSTPTVPSVFGETTATAIATLQGLGYDVEVRPQEQCTDAGRVLSTEPAATAPLAPGSHIVVLAADATTLDCVAADPYRTAAWAFLDWLAGRGPAPAMADRVDISTVGPSSSGFQQTLRGRQATDPTLWYDAAVLVDTLQQTLADGDRVVYPTMTAAAPACPADASCPGGLAISVGFPGHSGVPTRSVTLRYDARGRIASARFDPATYEPATSPPSSDG